MKHQVAIIGCGRPGRGQARGHVRGWQSAGCEVVALCDIAPENAGALRDDFGLRDARIYSDSNELLSNEKLDFVSVCLWPHLHAPVVEAAAKAGVGAIHCEKPVAPRLDEARAMVRQCEERSVQLTFNHQRRFLQSFQEAKRLLQEGAIGELDSMEAHCPDLFDWGTHWFDMMLGFNDQNPVEWAMGQVDWRGAMAIFGVPIERFGMAHFACQNGVRGTLVGGRGDEVENGVRVRLSGSKGQIEIGQQRGGQHQLRLLNEANGWQILPVPGEDTGDDPYPRVMADLVHCLENGATSILSARNALQATELIFGAYESARLGERVSLPLQGVSSHPLLSILREHDALPENTLIN
jgi:UDP-N-acetylglucosamine 3-dehydrogenase